MTKALDALLQLTGIPAPLRHVPTDLQAIRLQTVCERFAQVRH